MCETCGCGQAAERSAGALSYDHHHDHHHGHDHHHPGDHHHHDHHHSHDHHSHDHHIPNLADAARRVALGEAVLAHNVAVAAQNRAALAAAGCRMVDLISSPGSGKTTLLEATLDALAGELRIGVLAGDVRTDNDARRLAGRGARVLQVETGGACHLDATDVQRHLPALGPLDLLLVENVGNLVCPAAFDLGQTARVALLSVTEGEDKPLKYPALFHRSPIVLITKVDLRPHLRWDRDACVANIQRVRPDAQILELSAWTGEGVPAWLDLLRELAR